MREDEAKRETCQETQSKIHRREAPTDTVESCEQIEKSQSWLFISLLELQYHSFLKVFLLVTLLVPSLFLVASPPTVHLLHFSSLRNKTQNTAKHCTALLGMGQMAEAEMRRACNFTPHVRVCAVTRRTRSEQAREGHQSSACAQELQRTKKLTAATLRFANNV